MDKKRAIDPNIRKKILNFSKVLKTAGVDVEKIILYGSYAKGSETRYSDVDLCVVSPLFRRNFEKYFKKIWHLAAKIDSSLEPIPFAPEDLANKYSTLANEIRQHGISIV